MYVLVYCILEYQMCGRYTEVQIYANYYKITLAEVI
jgi:hypothetical protein